jgi:hypothetical protein
MYLLIDPPVSPFSPPEQITAWISELEQLAQRPEYAERRPRKQLRAALAQARSWLRTSERAYRAQSIGAHVPAPHPPS